VAPDENAGTGELAESGMAAIDLLACRALPVAAILSVSAPPACQPNAVVVLENPLH
jgi:hypothetical protein